MLSCASRGRSAVGKEAVTLAPWGTLGVFSFALKTLIYERPKLIAGLAGVVFSLVLISVQGGLYLGLMSKASLLVDHCDADLWVCHPNIENVDLARDIPEVWGQRLRAVDGVARVEPYLVGKGTATLPNGHMEDVWIIGSDPETMLGSGWNFVAGSRADLARPDGVSFDDVDNAKLGQPTIGSWCEVNGHRTRFVARTHGITGFITMPYLFTTYPTAKRLAHTPAENCSFLLVQLENHASRPEMQKILQARLPDAAVFTPAEFADMSQRYWMERTGIGISFGASTLMGLLVGFMVVGQSLYAMAVDHIEDYATLKAVGAEDGDVCRVIIWQALTIGTIGSILGIMVVAIIQRCWSSPLAPLVVSLPLVIAAIVTVFVICLISSLLPYLRIRKVDTALVLMG